MRRLAKTGLAIAAVLASPLAAQAQAQTAVEGKSERGMPAKAPSDGSGGRDVKSERAMPDRTKDSGTPPAASERAMPAPDKK